MNLLDVQSAKRRNSSQIKSIQTQYITNFVRIFFIVTNVDYWKHSKIFVNFAKR